MDELSIEDVVRFQPRDNTRRLHCPALNSKGTILSMMSTEMALVLWDEVPIRLLQVISSKAIEENNLDSRTWFANSYDLVKEK